ncbi:MAG: hypothetical protein ACLQMH_13620 [Solirubrobacteraceae bacterium]
MSASRNSRRQLGGSRVPFGIVAAWLYVYAGVWIATLAAAGVVALVGGTLILGTRRLLGLALRPGANPSPELSHVLALAAHNLPIAAWPLLLGLTGATRHRLARHLTDSVVVACILANTAPVGAALGAYGTALIAYVPQLPVEWAGLALGYGSWLVQRERSVNPRERVAWLGLILVVLLVAATLETMAVPHR